MIPVDILSDVVRPVDSQQLTLLAEFNLHTAPVNDILYLPDADACITSSEDQLLQLWVEDSKGTWTSTANQHLNLKPTALAWDGCRQWVRDVTLGEY